jgi:hypothetical protein
MCGICDSRLQSERVGGDERPLAGKQFSGWKDRLWPIGDRSDFPASRSLIELHFIAAGGRRLPFSSFCLQGHLFNDSQPESIDA